MKKLRVIFAGLLVFAFLAAGCSSGEGQTTAPTTTAPTVSPTSSTNTTAPNKPSPTPPSSTATSPLIYGMLYSDIFGRYSNSRGYQAPAEENTTVDDLLRKYSLYPLTGLFCDYEYVTGDMSQYLTDAQKENYYGTQYRITCCKTADQVHAHTAKYLDESLITVSPDEMLFTDDKGGLYLAVVATDISGYHSFYTMSPSKTQMITFAQLRYDSYEEGAIFFFEKENKTWKISAILSFDGNANTESYRYLLEDIPASVDPAAYGALLSDAFFLHPESFLTQLGQLEQDSAAAIAQLVYENVVDVDLYLELIDALDDYPLLTASQRQALISLQLIFE